MSPDHVNGNNGNGWIPKAEAAQILGISLRQLERREASGYIRKKTLDRPATGRGSAPVFYALEDIEAIRDGRPHNWGVPVDDNAPAAPQASGSTAIATRAPVTPLRPDWEQFCRAVATAVAPRPEPKAYLTIREAAEYSGLPVAYLKRMASSGLFGAIDVAGEGATKRAWRFRRSDF